jgi:hypothetical protein
MEPRLLIWARERRHEDTGEAIPDDSQTLVVDRGYGPVQGSRMVRPMRSIETICVDTDDLWEAQPDGTYQHADCNVGPMFSFAEES